MSDYKVIGIDEIPARDNWIPIRDQLGIGAFGVNAYRGAEAGSSVISDHTELMARHEELYVVVEGHATFTVDGEEVDAPAGTLVFVSDPATPPRRRREGAGDDVLVAGAKPGEAFEISPWEESGRRTARRWRSTARSATRTPRPCSARRSTSIRTLRGSSTTSPASRRMAGSDAATVAEHLGRAIELYPGFRDFARQDSDFEPVKDDPAIQALMEEPK